MCAPQNPPTDSSLLPWVALNAVDGLGPVRFKNLLERFGSPEQILITPANELSTAAGVGRMVASRIAHPDTIDEGQRQMEHAQRIGAHILTLTDSRYPSVLREVFAPPQVLFVRGQVSALESHAIGIVGTRTPTPYGRRATVSIADDLTAAGLTVVSGMARGIDGAAHRTCLQCGGKTIAILGCGVDRAYPASHIELAEDIQKEGALVSEYPLGTEPLRQNFPRRNRIISGMSAGVLVVEAGQRSGSLITANYALQQGRDVFAVPGPIYSRLSDGTFHLIRNGATPVRCGADIVDAIQTLSLRGVSGRSVVDFPPDLLNSTERNVAAQVSCTPVRIDELEAQTGLSTAPLLETLLSLELKGVVKQMAGQRYVRY